MRSSASARSTRAGACRSWSGERCSTCGRSPPARALRARLDARAEREGWPALHAELARLDPEAAARIAPNDSQRIQRALEVCYTSGEPISKLQRDTVSPLAGWPLRYWALVPGDRSSL